MTGFMKQLVVCAALGMLVAPAVADFSGTPMAVGLTRVSGYYSGDGGEFTLTPGPLATGMVTGAYADIGSDSWQTFCVERNEYVSPPGNYYGDLNTFATRGGAGGNDGTEGPSGMASDTLDARTAYLYQNFRLGTLLTSYSNGAPRGDDAGALQNAIWYLEGELSSISGKAVQFYNEAVEATELGTLYDGGATDGHTTWSGLGRVRVLNLWGDVNRTQYQQDQLALLPQVPVPGAVLLGVIGLSTIAWIRRRLS